MSSPDSSAPSAAPSPAGKAYKSNDDDSIPGGLPGAQQPKTPSPGGPGGSGG